MPIRVGWRERESERVGQKDAPTNAKTAKGLLGLSDPTDLAPTEQRWLRNSHLPGPPLSRARVPASRILKQHQWHTTLSRYALCLERRNAEKGAICNYARLFLQTKAKSSGSNGDHRTPFAFCWVKMGSVQPYERIGRRAHRKTERESGRIVCRVGNLIKGSANHCWHGNPNGPKIGLCDVLCCCTGTSSTINFSRFPSILPPGFLGCDNLGQPFAVGDCYYYRPKWSVFVWWRG